MQQPTLKSGIKICLKHKKFAFSCLSFVMDCQLSSVKVMDPVLMSQASIELRWFILAQDLSKFKGMWHLELEQEP